MSKQNKQPLLQHPAVVGVLASLLSIVIGLVLGFVLLVLLNPGASVGGMKAMMTTGFSSMDKLGKVLYQAAPLMMCGLSVGFASRPACSTSARPVSIRWRILRTAVCHSVPDAVVRLPAGGRGRRCDLGRLPGPVQGVLQCQRGHHRHHVQLDRHVLVNLLLANTPTMLASAWGASNSDRTAALSAANPGAVLPKGPFAALFGNSSWINISIIITIVFAVLVWVVLQRPPLAMS